jgi:DNA-binding MltR family transcriptional regulator
MTSEFDKLAEELKKTYGLNLADVLRSTHPETVIRVATFVGETLELALRSKLLAEKKPVNDPTFKGDGPLSTIAKRIDAAHDPKLIDDVTHKDAHLVRRIRNKFAHAKERLHFDSAKTVALAKQLSTYEAATFNQEAFLKAAGNIFEQAAKAVKALRNEPAQGEPESP